MPPKIVGAVLIVVLLVAACTVGPDFQSPPPPTVERYTNTDFPTPTAAAPVPGGEAQKIMIGRDIPAEWWRLFQAPALNDLIAQALAHNATLEAAQAALRQAQALEQVGEGGLFPSLSAFGGASRQQATGAETSPAATAPSVYNVFSASMNAAYTLDLFGSQRRQIEGLAAAVDFQQYELLAARLSISSNVVVGALQLAAAHEAILATEKIISAEEQQLSVTERSVKAGHAARADLLSARAQLASSRAGLPLLHQSGAVAEHLLAILTGRPPAEIAPFPLTLADFGLPQELPVNLPATLVRQRPDILASEAVLHQASAQIGVATANLLPQLTLSGTIGSGTYKMANLFGGDAAYGGLAAGLSQPLFQGGALLAQRRAALAAYDTAAAQYRQTVLNALQNVADALTGLANDAEYLKQQQEAKSNAAESLTLTEAQYAAGSIDYITLLTAQRQDAQSRIDFVHALAARYIDTAGLFQALGGGWKERDSTGTKVQ